MIATVLKIFFYAMIVLICINSRTLKDKLLRLLILIPLILASIRFGNDLFFYTGSVLLFGFSLGVYTLTFLQRNKVVLDYIKLLWFVIVVLNSVFLTGFRLIFFKSYSTFQLAPSVSLDKVQQITDIIVICFTLVLVVMIYFHNKKILKDSGEL